MAAYADPDDLDAYIETDEATRQSAVEDASGVIDGYLLLYEDVPIDFEDFDAGDQKTRLQARVERWCLSIAAHLLTSGRGPGQSEEVVKSYLQTIAELERVRDGRERLPLLTMLEMPVRARAF